MLYSCIEDAFSTQGRAEQSKQKDDGMIPPDIPFLSP